MNFYTIENFENHHEMETYCKILQTHTNFGVPQTNVIKIFEKKIFQSYEFLHD